MSEWEEPLWATGPGELLKHGVALLSEDTDTNRRLAMISIDNSVELMMQTYIQLPKRVTGLDLPRKAREDICAGFPNLLDGIEQHAAGKLAGINLGEIEWFHRLRNQLYHQGNGLTVERKKVEIYAEIAATFFTALFEIKLSINQTRKMEVLGEFLSNWARVEEALSRASYGDKKSGKIPALVLFREGVLGKSAALQYSRLRTIRAQVAHSKDGLDLIEPDILEASRKLVQLLEQETAEVGEQ